MNAARRKRIDEAEQMIQDARNILEEARDEEQEYYDNMPQSFQDADRGQNAYAAVEALTEVINEIDNFDSQFETART